MEAPTFFRPGLSLSSSTVKDALELLKGLEPEQMAQLAAELPRMARDFGAAAEFAQAAHATEAQVARIISLALNLHIASAAHQKPLAAAAEEAKAGGLPDEDVGALSQFLGYLGQQDAKLGAYLGSTEALRCGIPEILDAQITWSLRAAFGDAVYREGEPTDSTRELTELIPVGILKIAAEGADPQDHVFQLEASDLDWLIKLLEAARDRLDAVSAYAFSPEEGGHGDEAC